MNMQVELSAKELSLIQCAIVHAELFWKKEGSHYIPNSADIADLLYKISTKVAKAISDEQRTG